MNMKHVCVTLALGMLVSIDVSLLILWTVLGRSRASDKEVSVPVVGVVQVLTCTEPTNSGVISGVLIAYKVCISLYIPPSPVQTVSKPFVVYIWNDGNRWRLRC